jgi:hypothetical protein
MQRSEKMNYVIQTGTKRTFCKASLTKLIQRRVQWWTRNAGQQFSLQNRHTEFDSNSTDFSLRHNFHTSSGVHPIFIQWVLGTQHCVVELINYCRLVQMLEIREAQYFNFHFFMKWRLCTRNTKFNLNPFFGGELLEKLHNDIFFRWDIPVVFLEVIQYKYNW